MSKVIINIFQQKIKPKEKINLLVEALMEEKISLQELLDFYSKTTDSQKGSCLSALAEITKEEPRFVGNMIDFVIKQLPSKAPRVKWEAGEIIANIAAEYPQQIASSVPELIKNSKQDNGTVVRWSAAFALTEIVRSSSKMEKQLLPKFRKMIDAEKNNGVKKFYIKTLREFPTKI